MSVRIGIAAAVVTAALALAGVTKTGTPLATCTADPGFSVSGMVVGYQPGKGVYLALYKSAHDFENGRYCRNMRFVGTDLPEDTIHFAFTGLPSGDYLIESYQDADGNGELTRGLFGTPKDPYRIYRPNYGLFGPKFDNCRFRVERDIDAIRLDYGEGNK